jgi:hypothetical protein
MDRLAVDPKILLALGFAVLIIESYYLQSFLGDFIGRELMQAR